MKDVDDILNHIVQIENGFVHINDGATAILEAYSQAQCFDMSIALFKHEAYQVRMLSTAMLGSLAATSGEALSFLKERVSVDGNWRVQEMLAKAFDEVCKRRGYRESLPLIEEWLNDENPNVIRAVTEGLRIWTSRPFFRENPDIAVALIAKHRAHESEYLRKSIGNALRDISKKHLELVRKEVHQWDLSDSRVLFTYKLATKLLK